MAIRIFKRSPFRIYIDGDEPLPVEEIVDFLMEQDLDVKLFGNRAAFAPRPVMALPAEEQKGRK